MIQKTGFFSWKSGRLAKGCQFCVKGEKLVLFATGICPRKCFYCPISDQKYNKDVIYANEMPVKHVTDIISEAKLCSAKGAGITGGDPLCRLQRTCEYIQALKRAFGKDFHIHLYTSLDLVKEQSLRKLYQAGLDEIRFHPDIDNDRLWPRIAIARKFGWDIGVEIPAIPGKLAQTRKLIDNSAQYIDFLNINELEISDSNSNHLLERSFLPKDDISYGVGGSEEIAFKLLAYCEKKGMNVHYCTTTLKDRVQLAKRIKKRAEGIRKPFDRVLQDGILIRGAVYPGNLAPGFGYNKKIRGMADAKKSKLLRPLGSLAKELRLQKGTFSIDNHKPRLLMSIKDLRKLKSQIKQKNFKPAIIHEYPTWDELELDVEFI